LRITENIVQCWNADPELRPSFKEIVSRLERLILDILPGLKKRKTSGNISNANRTDVQPERLYGSDFDAHSINSDPDQLTIVSY
jgi:hypothetical protein